MIARTITWRRVFIGARWAEIPVLHAHRGACGSQSCTSFTGARRVRLTKRASALTARGTARRHGPLGCGATRTPVASSRAPDTAHAGHGARDAFDSHARCVEVNPTVSQQPDRPRLRPQTVRIQREEMVRALRRERLVEEMVPDDVSGPERRVAQVPPERPEEVDPVRVAHAVPDVKAVRAPERRLQCPVEVLQVRGVGGDEIRLVVPGQVRAIILGQRESRRPGDVLPCLMRAAFRWGSRASPTEKSFTLVRASGGRLKTMSYSSAVPTRRPYGWAFRNSSGLFTTRPPRGAAANARATLPPCFSSALSWHALECARVGHKSGTTALEVNRGCAASREEEWWAGTGLNRRHQDFQSVPGRRTMHRHRRTSLANRRVSEGRGPEVHAMTDRCRRCFRQSSGKVNGPPTAVRARRADQEAG